MHASVSDMDVHLTSKLRTNVEDEVAPGHDTSESEVIREGVRLRIEERQWRKSIRGKISRGVAQARAGRLVDADRVSEKLTERIYARRKKRS